MDKNETVAERDREPKNLETTKLEPHKAGAGHRSDPGSEAQPGRVQGMMTNAMTTTEHVGSGMVGGVANVATDLVHGIGTVGGEVVAVVRDTANTAIAGVGSIGETAVHTVTGLLADLVGGLRDVGSAAVRGRSGSVGRESFEDASARGINSR